MLKMDLQGWELEALKGAEKSLQFIEVILTEVSFFVYGPRIETRYNIWMNEASRFTTSLPWPAVAVTTEPFKATSSSSAKIARCQRTPRGRDRRRSALPGN